jgi:FixJ family two-component response regulator
MGAVTVLNALRISPVPPTTPVVFVVDDDVSVRESLDLLIRSAGWESRLFASAEELLAKPTLRSPCCMVLDVRMTQRNGL